jgi:hypothetical protein
MIEATTGAEGLLEAALRRDSCPDGRVMFQRSLQENGTLF